MRPGVDAPRTWTTTIKLLCVEPRKGRCVPPPLPPTISPRGRGAKTWAIRGGVSESRPDWIIAIIILISRLEKERLSAAEPGLGRNATNWTTSKFRPVRCRTAETGMSSIQYTLPEFVAINHRLPFLLTRRVGPRFPGWKPRWNNVFRRVGSTLYTQFAKIPLELRTGVFFYHFTLNFPVSIVYISL